MAYDNELSGALFQNKKGKESHPDYRGECVIEGKKYEIAGWKKQSKNGSPYLSLKFQLPQTKGTGTASKPAPNDFDDSDDDIPF